MKYYSIHYATSNIGRGGFPQAQHSEMAIGKTVHDPDFVWKLRGNTFPNFQPYIGRLIVEDGSVVTDFISSAIVATGFICNDKVEAIVRQHACGDTHFYPLEIKHKGINYDDYKLMHCLNNYADKIDYEQSEFKRIRN